MTLDSPTPPPLPDEVESAFRRLRLPYARAKAPEVLATAASQRWDPTEVLRVLFAEEIQGREQAMVEKRRRQAKLPSGKTFEAWEEEASSIPRASQDSLRSLEWVGRAENLCLCGPSGSGKSHFAEALVNLAIDKGMSAVWHTLDSLTRLLRGHLVDETVGRAIDKLVRCDLIVVDDVGMLAITEEQAEALFRVIDAAYEKRSVIVTSNLHPAGFDELMPKTIATATVDRLLHHAHVVITEGTESYRLTQATAGKGVVPLG